MLTMAHVVENWRPSVDQPCAKLRCDGTKPIVIRFVAKEAEPRLGHSTLLLQAKAGGEEVWGLRMMASGRLWMNLGTTGYRETEFAYYPNPNILISFDPRTGRLIWTAQNDDTSPIAAPESFVATAHNGWISHEHWDYDLIVGAPGAYADMSPIGWKISVDFRYGESQVPSPPTQENGPQVDPTILAINRAIASLETRYEALKGREKAEHEPAAAGDVQLPLLHWEAMMILVKRYADRERIGLTRAEDLATQAGALVLAHLEWVKGRRP